MAGSSHRASKMLFPSGFYGRRISSKTIRRFIYLEYVINGFIFYHVTRVRNGNGNHYVDL